MQQDYAIRATGFQDKVRIFACRTTNLVNEIHRRHDTSATVSAAVGRVASIGAMMGLMHKGNEKITIQVSGDGPVGRIIVDADACGVVRGYVTNPQVDFPQNEFGKLDVRRAVGTTGTIYVIKDIGMKEPYRGSSEIISGEIGEDFTYYFTQSEQTPSAVGVGVLVDTDLSIKAAGGFIIQLFPGAPDEVVQALEQRLATLGNVSKKIDEGLTPEDLVHYIAGDGKILQRQDICFDCNCSIDRVKGMIKQLGLAEVQSMLSVERQAEVVCNFCNEKHMVSESDLEQIESELEGK
ncbi:Hsp33 family molecular chaperone [Desulfuribacillus stibiiarsenatis]|uniref:33 kDa chaperonin n=2 Tax=Desulfuribacillus stibiiarsenatis TaxID=1390249 RepID=A0A1E5L2U1_9FIRM|nr:Hsp33 family molecular chaperone [Desulfuribacillus stibiiarsenatis]